MPRTGQVRGRYATGLAASGRLCGVYESQHIPVQETDFYCFPDFPAEFLRLPREGRDKDLRKRFLVEMIVVDGCLLRLVQII